MSRLLRVAAGPGQTPFPRLPSRALASFTSTTRTRAPCSATRRHVSRPIPPPPPVTITAGCRSTPRAYRRLPAIDPWQGLLHEGAVGVVRPEDPDRAPARAHGA